MRKRRVPPARSQPKSPSTSSRCHGSRRIGRPAHSPFECRQKVSMNVTTRSPAAASKRSPRCAPVARSRAWRSWNSRSSRPIARAGGSGGAAAGHRRLGLAATAKEELLVLGLRALRPHRQPDPVAGRHPELLAQAVREGGRRVGALAEIGQRPLVPRLEAELRAREALPLETGYAEPRVGVIVALREEPIGGELRGVPAPDLPRALGQPGRTDGLALRLRLIPRQRPVPRVPREQLECRRLRRRPALTHFSRLPYRKNLRAWRPSSRTVSGGRPLEIPSPIALARRAARRRGPPPTAPRPTRPGRCCRPRPPSPLRPPQGQPRAASNRPTSVARRGPPAPPPARRSRASV